MKSCEERTEYIISEINKRQKAKIKKRRTAERFATLAVSFCFAVVIGVKVFPQMEFMRKTPVVEINDRKLNNTPDISQINDVSAYVSHIISITSVWNEYSNKNSFMTAYTTYCNEETQAETEISSVSKKQSESPSGTVPAVITSFAEQHTAVTKAEGKTTAVTKTMSADSTRYTPKTTGIKPVSETRKTSIITRPSSNITADSGENNGSGSVKWEDMTIYEQFDAISFNGTTYTTNGRTIVPESIPEKAGDITAVGNDYYANEIHYTDAEAFIIDNIPDTDGVAVRFKGHTEYYVYTSINYFASNNSFLFG